MGRELFAYSLVNHSTWLVADLEPGAPGSGPGDITISYGDAIFLRNCDAILDRNVGL